jgi:hypothetical protein
LVGKVSTLSGSLRLGILSIFLVTPVMLYLMWRVARELPLAEATKAARARAVGEPVDPDAGV